MVFSIAPLGLLLLSGICLGQHFSYEGNHGPSHWADEFPTCAGKYQSPINIEKHNVTNINLPSLKLIGLDNSSTFKIINNGHTVQLKSNGDNKPIVTGGPLYGNVYVFEQLHFHWGKDDNEGSEHLINNHSFSMEMHAVFYKKSYKSMDEAVKHLDGLAVLGYLYQTSYKKANPTLKPIVKALPDIEIAGEEKTLHARLKQLLVPNHMSMQDYFTYYGSLTTPPCSEVVTWIVFDTPQRLSDKQLAAFRDLRADDGQRLTHNFRPVQPLEDRIVYHNLP